MWRRQRLSPACSGGGQSHLRVFLVLLRRSGHLAVPQGLEVRESAGTAYPRPRPRAESELKGRNEHDVAGVGVAAECAEPRNLHALRRPHTRNPVGRGPSGRHIARMGAPEPPRHLAAPNNGHNHLHEGAPRLGERAPRYGAISRLVQRALFNQGDDAQRHGRRSGACPLLSTALRALHPFTPLAEDSGLKTDCEEGRGDAARCATARSSRAGRRARGQ